MDSWNSANSTTAPASWRPSRARRVQAAWRRTSRSALAGRRMGTRSSPTPWLRPWAGGERRSATGSWSGTVRKMPTTVATRTKVERTAASHSHQGSRGQGRALRAAASSGLSRRGRPSDGSRGLRNRPTGAPPRGSPDPSRFTGAAPWGSPDPSAPPARGHRRGVRADPRRAGTRAEPGRAGHVLADVVRALLLQVVQGPPAAAAHPGGAGTAGAGGERRGGGSGRRGGGGVQDRVPQPPVVRGAVPGGGARGRGDHPRHPGHGGAAGGQPQLAAVRRTGRAATAAAG